MPIYEYECTECAHRTEVLQRIADAPPSACPECGGAVKRLLSAPAFQFKGSGWYVTGYARKGVNPGNGSKSSESSESSKSEGGKGESRKTDGGSGSAAKAAAGSSSSGPTDEKG